MEAPPVTVAPPRRPIAPPADAPVVGPDDDLDPDFPDLDGVVLREGVIALPDARTLSILRSRLTEVDLDVDPEVPIDVHDSVLVGMDLTGRCVTDLSRVQLTRCRLGGADLGDATLRDVTFEDCVLDLVSARSATFERVVIAGGRAESLDNSGARWTDVTLRGLALTSTMLDGIRATRVDVRGSDVAGVLTTTVLEGMVISPVQAVALAARLATGGGITVAAETQD